MDGTLTILCFSLAMFLGCLFLGFIPLTIRLSEGKLKLVTVLGAGLLCGTALTIIIPEGVELLLDRSSTDQPEPWNMTESVGVRGAEAVGQGVRRPPAAPLHSLIGVSLIVGFLLMFVVDELANCLSDHAEPRSGSSVTATIGLVIHAAADGVALGTAAASSLLPVQVIVFLAVILHKAPAAFALVSFLLHAGLERRQIHKHLLVFSLAAPLLAITTFFIVSTSRANSTLHRTEATGMGMLFSAGTFLYVASVHVLPEVSGRGRSLGHMHHREGASDSGAKPGLSFLESLVLITGCVLPLLLSLIIHEG
ncbi:zinc transporter ZIP9-B [Callorhinchus milii]|uniref:Zinc transporter ZIP9 n=1 Tax=Callorhinchus milii TaxID=7868 RepID=A0A4W3JXT5_CALMI|nr:zinc transporter ZIP9-B [Callorhinchus milii]|eukprot:gi/632960911/ref/XP_007896464.1/ PREDICTED: zinc transporter ZIP9-B-like [Callorhinchus milii]